MARLCTACGTPLGDETARFCAKCGAAVATPNFWVNERGRELIGDVIGLLKRRTTIIVVGAVGLVIVAIAIPNLLRPGAASSQRNTPATSDSPTKIPEPVFGTDQNDTIGFDGIPGELQNTTATTSTSVSISRTVIVIFMRKTLLGWLALPSIGPPPTI